MDYILAWFAESLWERLLLCAETATIVISGPLAWWYRLTLKKESDQLNAKVDRLLAMMASMLGKPEEEQRKIVRLADVRFSGKAEGKLGPVKLLRTTRREHEARKCAEELIKANFRTPEEWEEIERKEGVSRDSSKNRGGGVARCPPPTSPTRRFGPATAWRSCAA